MNSNEKENYGFIIPYILHGCAYKVHEDEDWAYYHVGSSSGKLYRIRKDGTDIQLVMDAKCCGVNIVGDWIYHCRCDEGETLHKIRKDGTGLTKLDTESASNVCVVGDWIYYCGDLMSLYRISTDGTNKTKMIDDKIDSFEIIDDWIYYEKESDAYAACRFRIYDGSREWFPDRC